MAAKRLGDDPPVDQPAQDEHGDERAWLVLDAQDVEQRSGQPTDDKQHFEGRGQPVANQAAAECFRLGGLLKGGPLGGRPVALVERGQRSGAVWVLAHHSGHMRVDVLLCRGELTVIAGGQPDGMPRGLEPAPAHEVGEGRFNGGLNPGPHSPGQHDLEESGQPGIGGPLPGAPGPGDEKRYGISDKPAGFDHGCHSEGGHERRVAIGRQRY